MKKSQIAAAAVIAALSALSAGALVGCGGDDENVKPDIKLQKPSLSVVENVVSWNAVAHASGYTVKVNDKAEVSVSATSYTINETAAGEYVVYVKATAKKGSGYKDSDFASVKYVVEEVVPEQLRLVANPQKTEYFLDETHDGGQLDTTGLVVELKYSNDATETVTPTVGNVDLTTVGEKTVELTYSVDGIAEPFKTTFVVTVRERNENDIGDALVKKTYEYDKTAVSPSYKIADGEVTAVDMKGAPVEVKTENGSSYVSFNGSGSRLLKIIDAQNNVSFVRVNAAYFVRTEADFMSINDDLSASYVLANDIVLEGEKDVMIGAAPVKAASGFADERAYTFDKDGHTAWTYPEEGDPIPQGETGGAAFTGSLDGNGYAISGYVRDIGAYWKPEAYYMGLFAYIGSEGRVENVTLRNTAIKGGKLCGIVAGVNLGTVRNVVVEDDCTLYANYSGGGIVAYNSGTVQNVVCNITRGESGYGGFDIAGGAYESDADASAENVFVGSKSDLTDKLGEGWFYVDAMGTVYGNDSYKKVISMPTTMYEAGSDDITAEIKVYQKTVGEVSFITWVNGTAVEDLIGYVSYDEQSYAYTVKLNVTDRLEAGDRFSLGVKSAATGLFIGAIKEITVGEPYSVGAEYKGEPLSVMQNTNIALNNVSLEVTYSDGSKQSVTPVRTEGFDNTAEIGAKQNVKFFYGEGAEQFVTIEVTVIEVSGMVASSVSAVEKTPGTKIVVAPGADFDIFEYYDITVGYSDGSSKQIEKGDAGLVISAVKAGLNNISLTYTDGAVVSSDIQNVAVWQEISTVEQFDAMNDNLSGYYILANDLDFNYTSHKISSVVSKVVGESTVIDTEAAETTAFTGKFDGGGHTISGWRTTYETGWNAQFFGYSLFAFIGADGEVGNFTLSNYIASACNYHSFISTLNKGKIYDVTIDDTCSIRSNWGAAAAFAAINNGTVQNCTSAVAKFTQLNGKYEGEDGVTEGNLNGVVEGNAPVDTNA